MSVASLTTRSTCRGDCQGKIFYKSRVWDKVPEGSTIILGDTHYPHFLTAHCGTDGRKPTCQNPISACDRRRDRHAMITNSTLAEQLVIEWRALGKSSGTRVWRGVDEVAEKFTFTRHISTRHRAVNARHCAAQRLTQRDGTRQ